MLTVKEYGQGSASASAAFLQRGSIPILILINLKIDLLVFEAFALQNRLEVGAYWRIEIPGSSGYVATVSVNVGPTGMGIYVHRYTPLGLLVRDGHIFWYYRRR